MDSSSTTRMEKKREPGIEDTFLTVETHDVSQTFHQCPYPNIKIVTIFGNLLANQIFRDFVVYFCSG